MKRRVWSLLLAAALLLSLGVTALAEQPMDEQGPAGTEETADIDVTEDEEKSEDTEVSEDVEQTEGEKEEPADEEEPADGAEEPADKAEEPTDETEEPADKAEEPSDGAEELADEAEGPAEEAEEDAVAQALSDAAPIADTVTITYDDQDHAIQGDPPTEVGTYEEFTVRVLKTYALRLVDDSGTPLLWQGHVDYAGVEGDLAKYTVSTSLGATMTLTTVKLPMLEVKGGVNKSAMIPTTTYDYGDGEVYTENYLMDGSYLLDSRSEQALGAVCLKDGYTISAVEGGTRSGYPQADDDGTVSYVYYISADVGTEKVVITIGTAAKSRSVRVRLANGYSMIGDAGYIGVTPNSLPYFDGSYHKGSEDMGMFPCGERFQKELGYNYDIAFDIQAWEMDTCYYLTFQGGTVVSEPMTPDGPGVDTHGGDGVAVTVDEGAKELVVTVHERKHDWKHEITKPATCVDEGEERVTCSLCGVWEDRTIPATGEHTWDDGTVTKAPTYLEPGEKTITCTVCKTTKTEAIDPLTPEVAAETAAQVQDQAAVKDQLNETVKDAVAALAAGEAPAGMDAKTAEAIQAKLAAADAAGNRDVAITTDLTVTQESVTVDGAVDQYDIEIEVKVDGESVGNITSVDEPIRFVLPLPENLPGRIVYVLRDHEGQRQKLASTVAADANGGRTVSFSSDKFSTFAIMASNDIGEAVVSPIPDQKYTGKAVTPKVTVTINGTETLTEDVDYKVRYEDNTEPTSRAKAVIVGLGDFEGTEQTVFFKIVKAASGGTGGGSGESGAPKTGDEAPLALYAGLLALSLAGLGVVLGRKKRTER